MLRIFTTLFVAGLFCTQAVAQISMTSSSFLALKGKTITYEDDARFSIPINIGQPGANQTWDFTNQTIPSPETSTFSFLEPQQTAYADSFPLANFVTKLTTPDFPGYEDYLYSQFTASNWFEVGRVTVIPPPNDSLLVRAQSSLAAPLPVQYNDTWTTVENDTSGDYPTFAIISKDSTISTVDGWGTLKLPVGDYQCLRLQNQNYSETMTVVNGVVISSGSEFSYVYIWAGHDHYQLAWAQSQFGETDPNFTNAQGYGKITDISTAIGDPLTVANAAQDFRLLQNYPNPFNPATSIAFEVLKPSQVRITIYDALGRQTAVLLDEFLPAGNQAVEWNAADLATGNYFYRVETANQSAIGQAVLVK